MARSAGDGSAGGAVSGGGGAPAGGGGGGYGGDIFSLVRQSIAGTLPGQRNAVAGWANQIGEGGGNLVDGVPPSIEVWTPGMRPPASYAWMPSYSELMRDKAIATSPAETPGPWYPTDTGVFDPAAYDARLVEGSRWVKEGDDPATGKAYMYWGNGLWGDDSAPWAPFPYGPGGSNAIFWKPDFKMVPAGWKQFTKGWAKGYDVKQYSPAWDEWYSRDRHGAGNWADYWSWGASAPGEGRPAGGFGCAIDGSTSHTTAEHWSANYQDIVPKFANLSRPGSWRT